MLMLKILCFWQVPDPAVRKIQGAGGCVSISSTFQAFFDAKTLFRI